MQNRNEQLTPHFKWSEFDCHDGTIVPKPYEQNAVKVAKNLEVIRLEAKQPIIVIDSYRTPKHNKAVKGAPHSQHLQAKAADIRIKGMEPEELQEIILALIKTGKISQGGVGLYDTFVHYDIRGTAARWDLRTP